ncbi:hypothetical protein DCAR_0623281 [Daucus carota subsp. sativus]|uniref:BHLH domain-containing protein n=1 Tax=Daucus carota subsp. sativus TaxID=79200 RepID=A0A161ZQJ5_DAUCS|nr:PREDICTED: transcription factor FER-LIKE IRON DEFICIENCY-INDUCED TRANSCRIPTION FACTOR-like isoform X2 [Daucus carota subsp. sativus]WOH03880.1 hypothetical protein DCAR_0623281 [Daucus carota subsp. sativus]
MERTDSSGFPMAHVDEDSSLVDFMDEANIEQFIALIRVETADEPNVKFCHNFLDCDHINGCTNEQFDPGFGLPYDHFNDSAMTGFSDPGSLLNNSFPNNFDELKQLVQQEEDEAEEYSSGNMTTTTTSTQTKRSTKGDRSRTLISERRRRSRMKDKLYALRALVPNITKMDKASIVGDAALYVQELQMQAKKLKAEVASLESSLTGTDKQGGLHDNTQKKQVTNLYPVVKKILQIDVYQVEEKGYYVRVVSNKGHGVAASLYKALESFSTFTLQSSNLATLDHTLLFTFALNVRVGELDMNLPNLKLWVAGALLNQGFDFKTSPIGLAN